MAFPAQELHFVLIPLMQQGHMIPMVDMARILAQQGVTVTIITTPHNANRFKPVIARAIEAKLHIQVVELQFPSTEAGLPQGCENADMLPSIDFLINFYSAIDMLQERVEEVLQELKPMPSCIISDGCFYWTADMAQKFHIPRLVFRGRGCFPLVCVHNLRTSGIMDGITSDSEHFVIPGLPDRIELTKAKFERMGDGSSTAMNELRDKMREAEKSAHGIVVNTFLELETQYAKEYAKATGKNVWCIGPVSLCNENIFDIAERGNKAAIDENDCLKWLDLCEPSSVVYACLGSLSRSSTAQTIELGLGLELSNRPFIWCVRQKSEELERWFSEEGFEERVKDRGLVIHGWAPQVLILSHQAVGGFLTHCGWNSTLEGVCASIPMITWPHFADQFLNERFVVEILKIGVRIGVEVTVWFGDEEKIGVSVKKEDIKIAADSLMDEGVEGEERRKRARQLGDMAKRAMEHGGSSQLSITKLIEDIKEQLSKRNKQLC